MFHRLLSIYFPDNSMFKQRIGRRENVRAAGKEPIERKIFGASGSHVSPILEETSKLKDKDVEPFLPVNSGTV